MKKTMSAVLTLVIGVSAAQALTEVQKKTDYIRRFDKDGDGKLNLAEYTEMTRTQLAEQNNASDYKTIAAERFKDTDADNDGSVTPEEIVQRLVRLGLISADADTGLPKKNGQ